MSPSSTESDNQSPVPVVGIGASAGGLDALSDLVGNLQADNGLAYLVVSHLDPRHDSVLAALLQKKTTMPVSEATEVDIEGNRIYVIPPDKVMRLEGNRLTLVPREHASGPNLPVNSLFSSLAKRQGNAIGIILSGTGSDGAEGVKAIKEAAGIVLVQDPDTAKFRGMPESAQQTGCADKVLSPAAIAEELGRLARHAYLGLPDGVPKELGDQRIQEKIFALLSRTQGVDFSQYKASTIERRLQRRMALLGKTDLQDYLDVLIATPAEITALYDDMLIRVTSFFRDEAVFKALADTVFPKIIGGNSAAAVEPAAAIRIWVCACATGEEAYSIAMLLLEYLGDEAAHRSIQIFATDLSDRAITAARTGLYPENIAEQISPERLARFFRREKQQYRVAERVRNLCVFSRHDAIIDPPFSRMDLVSCRNMLIYLGTDLKKRVLANLHYALKPGGFLLLGPAETPPHDSALFQVEDRGNHIFRKSNSPGTFQYTWVAQTRKPEQTFAAEGGASTSASPTQVTRKADGLLLARFSPAAILVDDSLNILQLRGQTGAYLEQANGTASLNIHRMVKRSIVFQLLPLIQQARETGRVARKADLRFEEQGTTRQVELEVTPLPEWQGSAFSYLIIFDPQSRVAPPTMRAAVPESDLARRNAEIELELDEMRHYMLAAAEAHEVAREEATLVQEELQSANEEFRSTAEEMETTKEELQSTNEELKTANDELRRRMLELESMNQERTLAVAEAAHAEQFSAAIVDAVAHPLVVLNSAFSVIRANPAFYDMFVSTAEQTLDHSFFELCDGKWKDGELAGMLAEVVGRGAPVESLRIEQEFPHIGRRALVVSARKVPAQGKRPDLVLLGIEDASAAEIRLAQRAADDRRKDEFLATLAHELRNPLAPIRNAVHLLEHKIQVPDVQKLVAMIGRQVTNMSRLVDDLMDVSRITRGQIQLQRRSVDLVVLLKDVVAAATPYFEQQGHNVALQAPPGPVSVDADPVRLEQVFGNLLNNAAKYTDRGGRIRVTLERKGSCAMVTVADNGIGIARDALPHIFEMFMQTAQSRTRAAGGLGIGLTLVNSLVRLHGGSVTARSAGVGQGSEFEVRLPLQDAARPVLQAGALSASSAPALPNAQRVLIVDDNVDSANSLASLIQLWGHMAVEAYDSATALELSRTFNPDIAILDISMADMNGYTLAMELKKTHGAAAPILIALTGYAQPSDVQAAKMAGFDFHLAKPVVPLALKTLLQTVPAA